MNLLHIRRIIFQEIDETGKVSSISYGVIANDKFAKDFNNSFNTLAELNEEIIKKGCILDLIDTKLFADADRKKIKTLNFKNQNWTI